MTTCIRCEVDLPDEMFSKDPKKKNGLQSHCRPCRAVYVQEWRYGLANGSVAEMMEEQEGRCPICKTDKGPFVVDHCHEFGNVRGMLCRRCNSGLGMFNDSPERLEAAIEYLVSRGRT